MDWRYWITYSGRVQTDSDDEDVAKTAAMIDHRDHLYDNPIAVSYMPELEVEPEGREGD